MEPPVHMLQSVHLPSLPHSPSGLVEFGEGGAGRLMACALKVLRAAGADLAIVPWSVGSPTEAWGSSSAGADPEGGPLPRFLYRVHTPADSPDADHVASGIAQRVLGRRLARARLCAVNNPSSRITGRAPAGGMNVLFVRPLAAAPSARCEYRQTEEVCQSAKRVSRRASEAAAHYAFACARAYGCANVTCLADDDGRTISRTLAYRALERAWEGYPDITCRHTSLQDAMTGILSSREAFHVVLTSGLHGDLLAELTQVLGGGRAMVPSVDVGSGGAIFEAVLPVASSRVDVTDLASVVLAGVMMLVHLGQAAAEPLYNAWLKAVEDHQSVDSLPDQEFSQDAIEAFGDAIVHRLGQVPELSPALRLSARKAMLDPQHPAEMPLAKDELVGIDVFVRWRGKEVKALIARLEQAASSSFGVVTIYDGGVEVWPNDLTCGAGSDCWQCRFLARRGKQFNHAMVWGLLRNLTGLGVHFTGTQHLYDFDGEPSYSLY